MNGHAKVVKYLPLQGADPRLVGCPSDDVYYEALKAAVKNWNSACVLEEIFLRFVPFRQEEARAVHQRRY